MHADLLSSILEAISKLVNQQSFNMWFRPISSASKDDANVYLAIPSEVFRDWINNNYFDVLEESLNEVGLDSYQVRFTISETKQTETHPEESVSNATYAVKAAAASAPGFAFEAVRTLQAEPVELSLNPKYTIDTFLARPPEQFSLPASPAVADIPLNT